MVRPGKMRIKTPQDATDWATIKKQMAEAPVEKRSTEAEESAQASKEGGKGGKADVKEKRREARRLRRQKERDASRTCFGCRRVGHTLDMCPENIAGVCYRCNSTEHTTDKCRKPRLPGQPEYPFATCFICKQKGHLSHACPDNPRGLYPQGGSCKHCGSVEHFKRDCPVARADRKAGGKRKVQLAMASGAASADAEDTPVRGGDSDSESDSSGDEQGASQSALGKREADEAEAPRVSATKAQPVQKKPKVVRF